MKKYMTYSDKTEKEKPPEDWKKVADKIQEAFENLHSEFNQLDISNVESLDLNSTKPLLQFENWDYVVENICNVEDLEDGLSKMRKIFKDSNFEKHYYSRIIEHEEYYKIDYGSHRCFFRVTKGDK